MKKIVLGTSLFLAMSSAFAGYVPSYQGFYVGGDLGSALMTASPGNFVKTNYVNFPSQGGDFLTVLNEQVILKGNVFRGDIFAGFGLNCDQLALGAEIFVGIQHYKESHTTASNGSTSFSSIFYNTVNTTGVKIKPFHAGLDVRPGFIINPTTMLYARVGFEFANVKMDNRTVFYGRDLQVEAFKQNYLISQTKNVVALRLGLGIEENVAEHLNLRVDYILTNYGRLTMSGVSPNFALATGDTYRTSSKTEGRIIANNILVGMTYTFC